MTISTEPPGHETPNLQVFLLMAVGIVFAVTAALDARTSDLFADASDAVARERMVECQARGSEAELLAES